MLLGLGLLILTLGIAAYVKLWTIDYHMSAQEALLIRKQFDLASREAMDESAEWRRRFDAEVLKVSKCEKELDRIKVSFKPGDTIGLKKKLEMLQKENMDLLEQMETLKQELEEEKLKCGKQHT